MQDMYLKDGRNFLYVGDVGRKLVINLPNLNIIRVCYETKEGFTKDVKVENLGEVLYADIPDLFLSGEYSALTCYAIATDGEYAYTASEAHFEIKDRQKSVGYSPTDQQLITWDYIETKALEYMNQTEVYMGQAGDSADNAESSAESALQSKNASAQSEANAKLSETNAKASETAAEQTLAETQQIVAGKADKTYVDSNLATKADKSELAVERARIDSLSTLTEGSTTGDAELIDIRIGADGVTYPNAGEAVRTQILNEKTSRETAVNELKGDLGNLQEFLTTKSSNRFDISKITRNQYINVDGSKTTSANFSTTDFIPVKLGEVLYFCAIRKIENGFQRFDERFLCAYDSDKNPLSSKGGTFVGGEYSVTEDVAYIVVSISNTYIDTYDKMYIGIYNTDDLNGGAYEEYGLKFNKSVIKNSYIVVDGKGNGDYRTINEALENANDSKDNPVTIIVLPSVYEESLILVGRYITLIGVDRDSCIVRNAWNDYLRPPLDLWSNSAVINMSFIAEATEETASGGASGKAYGIHIDQNSKYKQMKDRGQDTTDYEGVARVENCYVASRYVNGIGAGTCPNSTMIIKNCEIETLEKDNNGFMGGLRIHNYPFTGENQKAIVDNCIIHNPWLTPPVVLQDTNHTSGGTSDNVDTVFTFRNNIVYNEQGVNCNISVAEPHDSTCISGYIKKGISNFGNSNAKLN